MSRGAADLLSQELPSQKEYYRNYENSGGLHSHAVEPIQPKEFLVGGKEVMARTITHQGYTIESTPRHTDRGKWWQLHIRISRNDQRGVRSSEFPAQVLCASEQEADVHGIAYGQRIIEGKVKGMSVMDLKLHEEL
jgi:hypothetical protein